MSINRRQFLSASGTIAAFASVSPALAQSAAYPVRPITMVVPFAAGGPTDAVSRIVTGRMGASLGQSIVVENVGGADGGIGVGRVARAQGDGYTLLTGQLGTNVLNGAVYKLPYDLLADFEPIALLSSNPYVLVGRKNLPADNLAELIVWMKANQGKVSMGVASTVQRVSTALLQKLAGTQINLVPYRGGGPALQDVVAGQIDLVIDQPSSMLPQFRAGNVKAFTVTANERLTSEPKIPSNVDAGLPDFNISGWNAVWAPKNTPADVIARLNASIMDALGDETVKSRLRIGSGHSGPRAADAEGTARFSAGRDRQMVADRTRSRHQDRIDASRLFGFAYCLSLTLFRRFFCPVGLTPPACTS